MNNSKRWGLLVRSILVFAFLLAVPVYASAVVIGEQITNGDFSSGLTGWTLVGTTQTRLASNTINTSGGSAGFNNFFGSQFALLGDLSGDITQQTWDVLSSISQTFTLPSMQGGSLVSSYDIVISFRTAFDGRDSTGTIHDIFSGSLSGPSGNFQLFSLDSSGFPDGAPSTGLPNNQLVYNPANILMTGLLPGTYTLSFILDEKADTEAIFTNTAAGIDDVHVTGTANTVPEPSTLLLLGSGLLGLVGYGRRRMKK